MALGRVARPMERQYTCSVSKKMGPLGLSPGPKRFLQGKKQKGRKQNSRSSTGAMKGKRGEREACIPPSLTPPSSHCNSCGKTSEETLGGSWNDILSGTWDSLGCRERLLYLHL